MWGKGDKYRTMPLPPLLAEQLSAFIRAGCPPEVHAEKWARSDAVLLRRVECRAGDDRPLSRRHIENLYAWLHAQAPEVFADEGVSLHSYRHTLASWVDRHYDRAGTRAVLGHTSHRSPTDHYVHVGRDRVREALAAYEEAILAPVT